MKSNLDGLLESRYFLNVVNERTCFALYMCAFKSSGLIHCLNALLTKKLPNMFLSHLNEIIAGCEKILLVSF